MAGFAQKFILPPDMDPRVRDIFLSEQRDIKRLTRRSSATSAAGISMELYGVGDTTINIKRYMDQAVFFSSFVSFKTAQMVLEESRKHTPWDTGQLLESSWGPRATEYGLEGVRGPTVVKENIEGTVQHPDIEVTSVWSYPRAGGGFTHQQKWSVGYDAEYATEVHENTRNVQFNQPGGQRTPTAPWKYMDLPKEDHFLSNALMRLRPMMEPSMWKTLDVLDMALRMQVKQKATPPPTMGRLVKNPVR